MKKMIAVLTCLTIAFAAHAEDRLVTLLSQNKAVYRDEIYTFHVTYSDVSIGTNELRFTVTMLHQEGLGYYKAIIKCVLPSKLLNNAKREVMTNDGIGKNTLVRIRLPDNTPISVITVTTELKDNKGNVKTETRCADSLDCDIYFSDAEAAQAWNDELTKWLHNVR